MVSPPALQKGDRIAILATAKSIKEEDVLKAKELFESWGLEVVFGEHLFDIHHQQAGTDYNRLNDLQNAINDPDIKAIVCARGGYGTTRIVDQLDFSALLENPKWIAGFSDISALHGTLQNLGLQSLHSTMPVFLNLGVTESSLESLKSALFGEKLHYKEAGHDLNKVGASGGTLVGGNLSMLCNSIGTNSEIKTYGAILFIEDLTEYIYHIDRMIVQLKRANKLQHLAGLIVGHFSKMQDNDIPFGKTVEEIILEHTEEFEYPIAFGFPVGHEPHNLTMVCGREVSLEVKKKSTRLLIPATPKSIA